MSTSTCSHMAEEVWSGSSLGGSSFLHEDSDEMSHQSFGRTQAADSATELSHNSIVDREMKLVTEKYLSRRQEESGTAQSSIQVTSRGDNYSRQEQEREIIGAHEEHLYHLEEHKGTEDDYVSELSQPNHSDDSDTSHDMMELLLPSFVRLNKLLNENGCLTLSVTADDVNVENRSISVFVLDSWSESLTNFVAEVFEQRRKSREEKVDASFEVQKSDISISNLDVEVHHLQEKLKTAKEKEKQLRMQSAKSGEPSVSDIICSS